MENRLPIFILIFSWLLSGRGSILSQELPRVELPPRVNHVLKWLPVDAETLIVADGIFTVPRISPEDALFSGSTYVESAQSYSYWLIRVGELQRQLAGQNVLIAVEGSRRFTGRGMRDFGMLRFEGCQILHFDDSANDVLRASIEACFDKATKTIRLSETKVAVFASGTDDDGSPILVAGPRPGVLVCANSQSFLEQVLERMNSQPTDRALPNSLPEWQHVNYEAPVWAIRHYCKESAETDPSSPLGKQSMFFTDTNALGFVFWIDGKHGTVAKARYLTNANDALKIVTDVWHQPEEKLTPIIKEIKPGVIEISQPIKDIKEGAFELILMWYLGHGIVF